MWGDAQKTKSNRKLERVLAQQGRAQSLRGWLGVQAQGPNGAGSDMAMGLWSGKLKHRMATQGGYSTVDLLNLTALIPDR